MMTGNLPSATSSPVKPLKDKIIELRLMNQELERQKAARALEGELQLLRCRNQELTRQSAQRDQNEEIGERKR